MGKHKATKPNQAERAGKLDQLMDELPVKRRAKIEARVSELGLPAVKPRAGGKHTWRFRSHFRRAAFGWRGGRLAISRIGQALAELRAAARRDPALGAEGAVLFLEKLSPALCEVDDSSGALGSAARAAVAEIVPMLAAAPVDDAVRAKWLDRLYEALQEDDPPYLESLGDLWGELCAGPELAARWADALLPGVRRTHDARGSGTFAWFKGTVACYSALFAAGRHDELLDLLAHDRHPIWPCLIWGGRVLVAQGRIDDAIAYLKTRAGKHLPKEALARFAETALLAAGRRDEAYARYAIAANQAHTHLATCRAIARKYPEIEADRLLEDLIASTPDEEGKWFATAKSLGRFDLAIKLAWRSPCDPKTLTRAARDRIEEAPAFAADAALAALHWMAAGYGYELISLDAQEAHGLALEAGAILSQSEQVQRHIDRILTGPGPAAAWLRKVLGS